LQQLLTLTAVGHAKPVLTPVNMVRQNLLKLMAATPHGLTPQFVRVVVLAQLTAHPGQFQPAAQPTPNSKQCLVRSYLKETIVLIVKVISERTLKLDAGSPEINTRLCGVSVGFYTK
jgi:hypothetical protein